MGDLRASAEQGETGTRGGVGGGRREVVKGPPASSSHLTGSGVTEKGTISKEKLMAQL